ncbi:MAG: hypothetical protein AAGA62_18090, partial [Bacteroidota bacterium]
MTYAHKITTALVLLTCLFNYPSGITAQSTTWEGDVSNDWHEAGNWSEARVPNATDNVLIPALTPNQPELSSSGTCGSLKLEALTTLLVTAGGTLTVGDQGISIDNAGKITNEGIITVTRTNDDEEAFANRDSLINRGTINLTRGSVGFLNEGGSRLFNEVGGVINITDCPRGVELFTAVTNEGTFTVTGGNTGFSARRGFRNNGPGVIEVDGTTGSGFKAQSNNSFLNFGTIALGVNTAIADTAMIVNVRGGSGNYGAGEITIGSGTEGLVVLRANFENRAALNIDN